MKLQQQALLFLVLLSPLAGIAQSTANQQTLDAYFKKKTAENAVLQSQAAAAAIAGKYGGSKETENKLYKVFLDEKTEQEKAFAKFTGSELLEKLKSLALKTDSLKQKIVVGDTGEGLSASAFTNVLKYSKGLKLTAAQIDTLTHSAVKVDKHKRDFTAKNPHGTFDPKPLEASLSKILNDQQYESYLLAKYQDQATTWALGDWAEMKTYGLVGGLDSAKVVLNIKTYDMRRLMLKERYADDPAKLAIAISDIDKSTPQELTQLRSAKGHQNPTGTSAKKNSLTW